MIENNTEVPYRKSQAYKTAQRLRYIKNREKILQQAKIKYATDEECRLRKQRYSEQYYIDNREEKIIKSKQHHHKTKEANKPKRRKYYENNKDVLLANIREYHKQNAKKLSAQHKAYRHKHKEKFRLYEAEYRRKRCIADPGFRLGNILRNRISTELKRGGVRRDYDSDKLIDLIGCSIKRAVAHIEQQWKPEMEWCNHAKFGWHIDHIIPAASFDLTDPKQVKECFHYTNLQPLWWYDNLSKGTKMFWTPS